MTVHIPKVIHMDCKKEMVPIEGTNRRHCGWCDYDIEVEVNEV